MTHKEQPNQTKDTIHKTDLASIHYTGTLEDGTVFDSSEGRNPLQFEVGAGQVIPGFENAVEGMKLNQEKSVTIPAAQAYGEHKEELLKEIPRAALPKDGPEPQVGMQLLVHAPTGQRFPAMIAKVDADNVTLDLNHPLAGKDLTFKIKLVGINEPLVEEEMPEGSCCSEDGTCDEEGECADDENCEEEMGACCKPKEAHGESKKACCKEKSGKPAGGCGNGGCGCKH
ncbi:peptidylprolyl isomerase [Candidatus Woesearchaeota archaeon]|nr:peptidylprolyl isomerase [Candidatus Woesearchaeota archaeon]